MACIKYIKWLFIPVFAILLMSHNASALTLGAAGELSYNASSSAVVLYSNNADAIVNAYGTNNQGSLSFGLPREIGYVTRIVVQLTGSTGGKALVNIPYRVCFTNPSDMIAWIGFSGNGYTSVVSNSSQYTASGCISGDLLVYLPWSVSNIYLGGGSNGIIIGAFNNGGSIVLGKATIIRILDDADYNSVLNAIENNTDDIKSKLDDLEEAAQTQQEAAEKDLQGVENIENQSSDNYEMESANMSSLFSQFGGFITAVSGAHVGDCNIPANLNHINLGILNLCDNPVPDYAQVAVSIIVCMLVAPYLLNIIKRIIGIADKVREV